MMKEHDRQEHLKTLDENERKKEEEHYEEMRKKHADHPKVNHPVSLIEPHTHGRPHDTQISLSVPFPLSGFVFVYWNGLFKRLYFKHDFACVLQGSQNQLKEVWEEADGLDPEDFDPKTFFKLHGSSQQLSVLISQITDTGVFVHHSLLLSFLIMQIPMEMVFLMNRNWRHCSPKR